MRGKLIKRSDVRYDFYYSEDVDQLNTLSTIYNPNGKLSIKNCESIANGYDLDELAEERTKNQLIRLLGFENKEEVLDDIQKRKFYFIEGAKAILEIIGDKKFSESDMHHALHLMNNQVRLAYIDNALEMVKKSTEQRDKIIKSLQQTEFDVEIVEEGDINQCDGCNSKHKLNDLGMHIYPDSTRVYMVCQANKYKKPKLDADGCLILKRV